MSQVKGLLEAGGEGGLPRKLGEVVVGGVRLDVREDGQFWRETAGAVQAMVPVAVEQVRKWSGVEEEDVGALVGWDADGLPGEGRLARLADGLLRVKGREAACLLLKRRAGKVEAAGKFTKWLGYVPPQESSGEAFEMDDLGDDEGYLWLARQGYEVAGTIHTHPGTGTTASGTDEKQWEEFPGLHVIVGQDRTYRRYACAGGWTFRLDEDALEMPGEGEGPGLWAPKGKSVKDTVRERRSSWKGRGGRLGWDEPPGRRDKAMLPGMGTGTAWGQGWEDTVEKAWRRARRALMDMAEVGYWEGEQGVSKAASECVELFDRMLGGGAGAHGFKGGDAVRWRENGGVRHGSVVGTAPSGKVWVATEERSGVKTLVPADALKRDAGADAGDTGSVGRGDTVLCPGDAGMRGVVLYVEEGGHAAVEIGAQGPGCPAFVVHVAVEDLLVLRKSEK